MPTLAIKVDLPPVGELETSGDGRSPSDAQMEEEMLARQKFLETVSPYLESLTQRPPSRAGNVRRVEIMGRDTWSQLNHYLVMVNVDIGQPGIDEQLLALLPERSKVSVVGAFGSLQVWPEPPPA
ncbi:MAG: hypothetical protein QOE58_2256 [Actinomycetota bacterium]|nr:hypothetical protein [Actinomycetota bacterium]